uniref:Uncharacterized protein n=1 Tax=Sus scrofa TaxID=9823 RepID=A0A8D0UAK5_PIG
MLPILLSVALLALSSAQGGSNEGPPYPLSARTTATRTSCSPFSPTSSWRTPGTTAPGRTTKTSPRPTSPGPTTPVIW